MPLFLINHKVVVEVLRIAIVDDEDKMKQGLRKWIEKADPEYQVIGVYSNGKEALKQLEQTAAEVVITDIKMPQMDGLELIRHLKKRNADIKFIIVSGLTEFEHARTAIRLGVVHYLVKPIVKTELVQVLHELAQQQPKQATCSMNRHSRTIGQVKQLIEQGYKQEIHLSQLAKKVYLTPSYLSKRFKTEMNKTITDYIIEVRMKKAKELLRERLDLKVYEVAELVGYPDPVYFNKLFKKEVGMTPREYREQG